MDKASRQAILETIDRHRDKAIGFLQKMISIPSVTGDEAAIQAFLSNYLSGIGLDVDQWETDWEELKKHPGYRPVDRGYEGRPNIVATLKGAGGGKSLLLNGHTDVIPVGNGEGWSVQPWSAEIKDGRIYGRGSADMKSGVASHIMAVEFLKAAGFKLAGDVHINIVIDEEISGHGTLDTVIRGYRADAGISGETSDLAVQPACIGRIWFEIAIEGKPAGVQKRYEGVSGIELGYKISTAVQALEDRRVATVKHPLYPNALDSLPCLIGSFSAGNYPSAFPATCLLRGSIGTVPGEDHEGVKQSLVDQIAAAAAEDEWMKDHPPVVRFAGYDAQASEIPTDHPIVKLVGDNYREITGRAPTISGRQGAADTRFLNQYGNTPTVIFGPGSTAVMHANDEYVSIDDYITSIKVMALTIADWCGPEHDHPHPHPHEEEHDHPHPRPHEHGGRHHHAPESVRVQGKLAIGTLAIVDTPAGERMRFTLSTSRSPIDEASVAIDRGAGMQEILTLRQTGTGSQQFQSDRAPAEPHEFNAELRLRSNKETENLPFRMVEPQGHSRSHTSPGHAH